MLSIYRTRDLAQANGSRHFYPGTPCKRGHVSNRFVSNGACIDCVSRKSTIMSAPNVRAMPVAFPALDKRLWIEGNTSTMRPEVVDGVFAYLQARVEDAVAHAYATIDAKALEVTRVPAGTMLPAANGVSRAAYHAAGWTDEQLRDARMMA